MYKNTSGYPIAKKLTLLDGRIQDKAEKVYSVLKSFVPKSKELIAK
jgi:hypothetical protein